MNRGSHSDKRTGRRGVGERLKSGDIPESLFYPANQIPIIVGATNPTCMIFMSMCLITCLVFVVLMQLHHILETFFCLLFLSVVCLST